MITWPELEERAELYKSEAATVGLQESELVAFIEALESERPLRRRMAAAIIHLGVKLHPLAAKDVAATSHVAA